MKISSNTMKMKGMRQTNIVWTCAIPSATTYGEKPNSSPPRKAAGRHVVQCRTKQ